MKNKHYKPFWFSTIGNSDDTGWLVDPIIGVKNRWVGTWVDIPAREAEREEAKKQRLKAIKAKLEQEEAEKKELEAAKRLEKERRWARKARKLKVVVPKDKKTYTTKERQNPTPQPMKNNAGWYMNVFAFNKHIYLGTAKTKRLGQRRIDRACERKYRLAKKLSLKKEDVKRERFLELMTDYVKDNCQVAYKTLLALYGKDDQKF